jgi:hypothetical protein
LREHDGLDVIGSEDRGAVDKPAIVSRELSGQRLVCVRNTALVDYNQSRGAENDSSTTETQENRVLEESLELLERTRRNIYGAGIALTLVAVKARDVASVHVYKKTKGNVSEEIARILPTISQRRKLPYKRSMGHKGKQMIHCGTIQHRRRYAQQCKDQTTMRMVSAEYHQQIKRSNQVDAETFDILITTASAESIKKNR